MAYRRNECDHAVHISLHNDNCRWPDVGAYFGRSLKMVEFERLAETASKIIADAQEGGVGRLDAALTSSRTTSGTYRYTYDRYIQYFQERRNQKLTEQDLFIGFAFAYSWMSSIKQLDPALSTVRSAVVALNKLYALRPEELGVTSYDPAAADPTKVERVASMIEPIRYFLGSVIGTSKMLHFVNPDVFPIWDAFIHRYCRTTAQTSAADSLKVYTEYTFRIHNLIKHADYDIKVYEPLLQAMEQANSIIGDRYRTPEPMGKVRATEFIMFFGGKAEHAAA